MYRCRDCGSVFDESEAVLVVAEGETEPDPSCPYCGSFDIRRTPEGGRAE